MGTTISASFLFMMLTCCSLTAEEIQERSTALELTLGKNDGKQGLNTEYISSVPIIHSQEPNSIIKKRSAPPGLFQNYDAPNENTNADKTPIVYFLQPFDNENDKYPISETFDKRRVPPLGFYNGRGKKDKFDTSENENEQYFGEYPTRTWSAVEDDNSSPFFEEKRKPPSGFYAMRGKRQRRIGFVAMRGKRLPGNLKGSDDTSNSQDDEILDLKRLLYLNRINNN